MMQRIIVVGTSGSGKSTLARELSRRLDVPHIEMDALYWGPQWTAVEPDVFVARVREAVGQECWVMCGNYRVVNDIVFPRVDTLIWLDYPMSVVFMRSLGRSIWRSMTREPLWSGNRESLCKTFLSKDSILLWVIETWRRRRRDYPKVLKGPMCNHMRVIRLRSQKEMDNWLERVEIAPAARS